MACHRRQVPLLLIGAGGLTAELANYQGETCAINWKASGKGDQ